MATKTVCKNGVCKQVNMATPSCPSGKCPTYGNAGKMQVTSSQVSEQGAMTPKIGDQTGIVSEYKNQKANNKSIVSNYM